MATGYDNLNVQTASIRDLLTATLEEIDTEGGAFDNLSAEENVAVLDLVKGLAQATAIEQLAQAVDRFVDTYQLNTLGEGKR